jgi:glycine cleavage system regulatory protein
MWRNPVQNPVIVSFMADDRPGLVERVSRVIAEHGGNWQDGRLSQLGGKFAGLMLVQLPASAYRDCEEALLALGDEGIDCSISPAGEAVASEGAPLTLEVIGPDRPGIVLEVTRALREAGINLCSMESEVTSAAMSAEPLFRAMIHARAAAAQAPAALTAELDRIADTMALHIELIQDQD